MAPEVEVIDSRGKKVEAFIYIATKIDETLLPFSWYKKHVLIGAQTSGLSSDYITKIEKIKITNDPDRVRECKELSVYE